MSSTVGSANFFTKAKATNADLDIRSIGFTPSKVVVRNATSGAMLEWQEHVVDGGGFKTVAAGTRSFVATNGISLLPSSAGTPAGIRIGTLADINDTVGEDLYIECWSR